MKDRIVCLNNKLVESELTVGQYYEYKEINPSCVEIINNLGEAKEYIKERFIQPVKLWKISCY